MAALNGREVSSSGGGVHAPLHKRSGLNFADDGSTAALEMVRDFI